MADPGINMSTAGVRALAGNVSSTLVDALRVAMDVETMALNPAAFARLGSPVAVAATAAHSKLAQTLRALLSLLQQLNTNVVHAADTYSGFDQNAAGTLGLTSAGVLASQAQQSGTAATATPGSVGNVLQYLDAALLGPTGTPPPAAVTGSPAQFAVWLDDNQHQAGLGLTKVYAAGNATVRPGDVVVAGDPAGTDVIGVAGTDGQLYNNGPVAPLTALSVRGVYRPTTSHTALWS